MITSGITLQPKGELPRMKLKYSLAKIFPKFPAKDELEIE